MKIGSRLMQPPDGSTSAPPEFLQGSFSEACKQLWVRNKGMNMHGSENCLIHASFDGPGGFENAPPGPGDAVSASAGCAVVSIAQSNVSLPLGTALGLDLCSMPVAQLPVDCPQASVVGQAAEVDDSRTNTGLLVRALHAPEIAADGESANEGLAHGWAAPVLPVDILEPASRSRGVGLDGVGLDGVGGYDLSRAGCGAEGGAQPGEDSDEQLVLRVQFGDEEALALLRGRYAGLLQSQALRVLRSREEADDAVSEVFIEVWQRASCYHSERARPVAWLVTLVRRRAIDRLRVQQRQRKIELGLSEKQMYLMSDGGSPVEEEMRLGEIRASLEAALNKLPAEQGRAVWMAYCKGFSQKEISKITKAPVGTVKTRLEIGLRKMRQRLAQDESILNALRSGRLGKAPPSAQNASAARVVLDGRSSSEEAGIGVP